MSSSTPEPYKPSETPRPRPKLIWGTVCFLLGIGITASLILREDWKNQQERRKILLALDYAESREWAERSQYPWSDFLERLKAMGVAALRLKDTTARDLLERGEALFFIPQETEKLRLLGFLAPGASLKPMSLWIQNPEWSKRLFQAARRRGLELPSPPPALSWQVQLPSEYHLGRLSLGPHPQDLEQIRLHELTPIFHIPEGWMENSSWMDWTFSQIPENSWLQLPTLADPSPDLQRELIQILREHSHGVIWMESPPPSRGALKLLRAWKGHLERGYEEADPDSQRAVKFLRASRERSCRLLLLRFQKSKDMESNLALFRQVAQGLRRQGQSPEVFSPEGRTLLQEPLSFLWLRLFATFWIPVLGPVGVLWLGTKTAKKLLPSPAWPLGAPGWKMLLTYAAVSISSLLMGLVLYALLALPELQTRLYLFRGVKLTLLLPWIPILFLFYSRPLRKLLALRDRPITWGQASLVLLVSGGACLLLWRSGSSFPQWVWPREIQLRDWLESSLGIRPRWKEILLGYPLLLCGLWIYLKEGRISLPYVLGALAPISLLNSFCHIHTPWWISLGRSLHGMWLGLVIGTISLCAYSWAATTVSRTSETNSS